MFSSFMSSQNVYVDLKLNILPISFSICISLLDKIYLISFQHTYKHTYCTCTYYVTILNYYNFINNGVKKHKYDTRITNEPTEA